MRRNPASLTLFSIAASALAHAGGFIGLAYLVSTPVPQEPRIELPSGEATVGIGWVTSWDAETEPKLAPLEVVPPPIESIEPLIDRPEHHAIAKLASHEDFDVTRLMEQVKEQVAEEPEESTPTPPQIARAPDKPASDEPASSPPDRPGVHGDATIVGQLAPHYPTRCRRRGHEGTVLLECLINAGGIVETVRIARPSGCTELDKAAVDALRQTRFKPATEDGESVATTMRLPVQFRLARPQEVTIPSTRPRARR
jgi:protein TonB